MVLMREKKGMKIRLHLALSLHNAAPLAGLLRNEFFVIQTAFATASPSNLPAILVAQRTEGTKRNETVLSSVVNREGTTKERNMRVVSTALLIMAFGGGTAFAQNPPASTPHGSAASPDPAPVPVTPANPPNQAQPQGQTGPTTTTTGGAPASSPQGDAPPGMQPRPQGAPEQTVDPKK
jgi:hypothetical protein